MRCYGSLLNQQDYDMVKCGMNALQPQTGSEGGKTQQAIGWIVLVCGIVSGVLSALNIIFRARFGWPASHPWSTISSVVIPFALVSLAVTFMCAGSQRRVFAGIAIVLALIGAICGVFAF